MTKRAKSAATQRQKENKILSAFSAAAQRIIALRLVTRETRRRRRRRASKKEDRSKARQPRHFSRAIISEKRKGRKAAGARTGEGAGETKRSWPRAKPRAHAKSSPARSLSAGNLEFGN